MYKVVSAQWPKDLEVILNQPDVKQVINAWVHNGTLYSLIQLEIIPEVKTESKPETKAAQSKPKAKTPRKPKKSKDT